MDFVILFACLVIFLACSEVCQLRTFDSSAEFMKKLQKGHKQSCVQIKNNYIKYGTILSSSFLALFSDLSLPDPLP